MVITGIPALPKLIVEMNSKGSYSYFYNYTDGFMMYNHLASASSFKESSFTNNTIVTVNDDGTFNVEFPEETDIYDQILVYY